MHQHGLPAGSVVSLFAILSSPEMHPHDLVKGLVAEQQVIYRHVDEMVCIMEAQNADI
jgi:hypothetical protein